MSPILFSIYIEELTQRIKKLNVGIEIDKMKICILLFADDIVLITENEMEMQEMINEVDRYAQEMEVNFSKEKCQVMIINENEQENIQIRMQEEILEKVNSYKYLGTNMTNRGLENEPQLKRIKAEQWWGRINNMTKFRSNSYEIVRGLWKGVAVPNLMYNLEITNLKEIDIRGLETTQNKMARSGLGANKIAAVETLRGEMGWSTFKERIEKTKVNYRLRLEFSKNETWIKKIWNWRKGKGSTNRNWKKNSKKI